MTPMGLYLCGTSLVGRIFFFGWYISLYMIIINIRTFTVLIYLKSFSSVRQRYAGG